MTKPEVLPIFQSLIDRHDGVELKGAKSKYTAVNGNMFSFVTQEGQLAVRLPKEAHEKFLAKHENSVCIQYGAVMRQYVLVPDSILNNTRQLRALYKQSVDYAFSLKAKPTTRKKK